MIDFQNGSVFKLRKTGKFSNEKTIAPLFVSGEEFIGEYQAVRDSMCTYGENTLKHFPERIVFALSPADSEFLLDDLNVSGLQDNTVYFTDGVQGKIKLKPYLAPEVPELQEYLGISD